MKHKLLRVRFDLGLPQLVSEWKMMFDKKTMLTDVLAGLSVACIAIPLSLAIALASGVTPGAGLISAIVAGILCAFLGGTRLAVSGPAAAMAVLIASTVETYGPAGLILIGAMTGIMQFLTGFFGLGSLIRFVPLPVIGGFTAGIGAIILIGQLPRALGLPPPDQAHVFSVISHLWEYVHQSNLQAVMICGLTLGTTLFLPKFWKRAPASLIGIILATVLAKVLNANIETIGSIPSSLPKPTLPLMPDQGFTSLFTGALVVYAIASIETLLSSSAVDKIANKSKRHDPNQELIGQGIANTTVALFGGIPVTGVIARSGLNVQAGAKTRLSSIVHSLALLAAVYLFSTTMSQIPIAALAGVLLSVALRMLDPSEFKELLGANKTEAAVYLITFVTIVLLDLLAGVRIGILAAILIAAVRLGKNQLQIDEQDETGVRIFRLRGPLTFMSMGKIGRLQELIHEKSNEQGIIIDLRGIQQVDYTAIDSILETITFLKNEGYRMVIVGMSKQIRNKFAHQDKSNILMNSIASSEASAQLKLQTRTLKLTQNPLLNGVRRFRSEALSHYEDLFEDFANGQTPHTLFITCSDSRINPNLITFTDPGELFILRNVGNIVPPFNSDEMPSEGAAVEYAIQVLGAKNIVVCGHTRCGAIAAVMNGYEANALPSVHKWLANVKDLKLTCSNAEEAAKRNVEMQIKNILTYPEVEKRYRNQELKIYGWIYDVQDGSIMEWNETSKSFQSVTNKETMA